MCLVLSCNTLYICNVLCGLALMKLRYRVTLYTFESYICKIFACEDNIVDCCWINNVDSVSVYYTVYSVKCIGRVGWWNWAIKLHYTHLHCTFLKLLISFARKTFLIVVDGVWCWWCIVYSVKCIVWVWRSDETELSSYRAASLRCQVFNSRIKCKIYECKKLGFKLKHILLYIPFYNFFF